MSRLSLLTASVCLVAVSFISQARGYDTKGAHCVWYGVCGPDPDPPHQLNPHCLNCKYEGPAKQLEAQYHHLIDEACPHLREDLDGDLKLCCSPQQLQDLKSNFAMAGAFLGRCPTWCQCYKHLCCCFGGHFSLIFVVLICVLCEP